MSELKEKIDNLFKAIEAHDKVNRNLEIIGTIGIAFLALIVLLYYFNVI